MKLLAGLFAGWLLLGVSSCSGESATFESPSNGGTESSGSGSGAKAGSTAKGGSGTSEGGSGTSEGGSGTSEGGSSNGGTNTGGTSNPDQPNCETDLDALDRSCTTAADCVLVHRQIDCCGTILVMGLNGSEQAAFAALEQYCAAQFPACGCAAQGMKLEDGSLIPFDSTSARVECVDERCRSRNANELTPCGDQACTADQYCYEFVGGPAGSVPSYSCKPLGGCQECECLNVVGCLCSGEGSAIKVFCAAP